MIELKRNKAFAKKKVVKDFKSSDDFQKGYSNLGICILQRGFQFVQEATCLLPSQSWHKPRQHKMDRDLIEREEAEAEEEGNKEKEDK